MCQYQNPTCYVSVGELNEEEKQAILKKHNHIRREIGSSNMKKLVWDNELESVAQRWANQTICQYQNPACYVSVGGLNVKEKHAILKEHNDLNRGRKIEVSAQRWTEQCLDDNHDTNRKKLDGTEVGQNNFWLI